MEDDNDSGPRRRLPIDVVQRKRDVGALNQIWVGDIERHEALLNREGFQDPLHLPVGAGWWSWRQSDVWNEGKADKQPRQSRDGPAPLDGLGPASKTERCNEVNQHLKAPP